MSLFTVAAYILAVWVFLLIARAIVYRRGSPIFIAGLCAIIAVLFTLGGQTKGTGTFIGIVILGVLLWVRSLNRVNNQDQNQEQ
jgi:hypothetical protein